MLIKDTKYKQHRSKRFRPTPQAALMKDQEYSKPSVEQKELFCLERFDDCQERKLARQSIIYDDHLHTKPGYIAVCEEYERELAEANLNPEEATSKEDESGENECEEDNITQSKDTKPAQGQSGQKSKSNISEKILHDISERRKLKFEKRLKT